MSFLRYGLGNFRSCIWKEKFASVYQSTLAWYSQVWCFCDESPKIHGHRNKFRGCPCTRVHWSRRSRNFLDWWSIGKKRNYRCSILLFICRAAPLCMCMVWLHVSLCTGVQSSSFVYGVLTCNSVHQSATLHASQALLSVFAFRPTSLSWRVFWQHRLTRACQNLVQARHYLHLHPE